MRPTFIEETPFEVAAETTLVPFHTGFPMPQVGGRLLFQPLVIRGAEPVLVDTGGHWFRDGYLEAVFRLVEPADVRWIFLSHEDGDHAGGLLPLLEACPNARLLTSYGGIFKLFEHMAPPVERVQIFDIGDTLALPDRTLRAVRMPAFDSPTTRGLFDTRSRMLFTADAFGAPTPTYADDSKAQAPNALRESMAAWVRWNYAWFDLVDQARIRSILDTLASLQPSVVVSYHAPVHRVEFDVLGQSMLDACAQPPRQPFGQAALDELMKRVRT